MARFQKGQGGRPKGIPNKATREIKEASRLIVEDEAYTVSLKTRLLEGKAPHMETLLFHYAYGKPKDVTEHEGEITLRVSWLPS
jgi:hypothetical protein